MSDNEEKKQRNFRISPILLSTVFVITFIFCVCYFVVGFGTIWKFTVGLCLLLIANWYYTLLILTFIIGFYLRYFSEDDEYIDSGKILFLGSVIIFIILAVGTTARDIIKSKEEKICQEQSQIEIIQPETK